MCRRRSGFERSAQRLRSMLPSPVRRRVSPWRPVTPMFAVAVRMFDWIWRGRLHIHLDGVHPTLKKLKLRGAAHRDLHSVAGLDCPTSTSPGPIFQPAVGDTDHNLLFVPGVYGDIAVVGLDAQRGLVRNHEGLGPIVGKRASGRESGDDGGLNCRRMNGTLFASEYAQRSADVPRYPKTGCTAAALPISAHPGCFDPSALSGT